MRHIHDRLAARPEGWGVAAFLREERGATAVEFAILAFPFFAFILTILDIAAMMFVERTTKAGTNQHARYVRTGQLPADMTADEFRQCLCRSYFFSFVSCDDIKVDLKTLANWNRPAGAPRNAADNTVDDSEFEFSPGGESQIKLLSVYVTWPRLTPIGAQGGSQTADGRYVITSRSAFRTEPYQAGQSAPANHPCAQ